MNIYPPSLQGFGRRKPAVPKLRRGHPLCNGLTDCMLLDDLNVPVKNLIPGGSPGTTAPGVWQPDGLHVSACAGYVSVGDEIQQGTVAVPTTGSLSIWAYPNWEWNDGVWHSFFSVATFSGSSYQFRMIKFSDNNIYTGWVSAGVGTDVAVSGSSLVAGAWNHLVFTWIANSTGVLYINGSLAGTNAAMTAIWDTTGFPRRIGKFNDGFSPDDGFNGRLFFYQLWDRALTPVEARLLWDKPFDHFVQPASTRAAFAAAAPAAGGFRAAWAQRGVVIGGGTH